MKDTILEFLIENELVINDKFFIIEIQWQNLYCLITVAENDGDYEEVMRFSIDNVKTIDIHFDTMSAFITFKGFSQ